MRCHNINTAEYKALKAVYKTDAATGNIIDQYQEFTKTETVPTVAEASEFVTNRKTLYNLKQIEFGQALLNNLSRLSIIHSYQGRYYINNTDQETLQASDDLVNSNVRRLNKYLETNNIPIESVNLTKTPKTFAVSLNSNLFTAKDMLESSRSWDTPRARKVVTHLMRLFPNLKVKLATVSEARILYENIPQWRKARVPFDQINSFYVGGNAVLIKGRVTDETAIEEMLHPFVEAVKLDNIKLFEGLLGEAGKAFPEMKQLIDDAYNRRRGITADERNMELVTQALSRHFNNEYEESPTQSFMDKIRQFLDWFASIIKNLNEVITGRTVDVSNISESASLSDIAKLLNTSGLVFNIDLTRADGRIKYSLSQNKQNLVNKVKAKGNELQKRVIDRLVHNVSEAKEMSDTLSGGPKTTLPNTSPLVILNKKDNKFYDLTNRNIVKSASDTIGRKPDSAKTAKVKQDVRLMMDAIAADQTFTDIQANIQELSVEQAQAAFNNLAENINTLMNPTDVMLTNVTFYDKASETAAMVDGLIINRVGHFKYLKLQINDSNVMSVNPKTWAKGVLKQDIEKSKYYQDKLNLEGKERVLTEKSLTQAVQDQIEIGLARRMAENQGYESAYADDTTQTLLLSYKGKALQFHAAVPHTQFNNERYIDQIVPFAPVITAEDEVEQISKDLNEGLYDTQDSQNVENIAENIDPSLYPAESTVSVALDSYYSALIDEGKVRDMTEANIFSDRTEVDHKEQIANTLAYINIARQEGPASQSVAYTRLLKDALRQMKAFEEYVIDPANVSDEKYITYVMNFNQFLSTFEGLYAMDTQADLNATQRSLIGQINIQVTRLLGRPSKAQLGTAEGIVNKAILEYVHYVTLALSQDGLQPSDSNILQSHSGRTFTVADIKELLSFVPDITTAELYSKDLATSKDFLLASMDKVFKIKRIEFLDRVRAREKKIREAGAALLQLSPEKDLQKLYDFMLEFDENGEFTGLYTQRIGQQYFSEKAALRDKLYDVNGKPYEYRKVTSLINAKQEDIDYNKDLYRKKKAFGDFMRAEVYEDGQLRDGKYHKFTDEYKQIRAKWEYFQPYANGTGGTWRMKPGTNKEAYDAYRRKYYQEQPFVKMYKDGNGDPTGAVKFDQSFPTVRSDFREVKDSYLDDQGNPQSNLNPKYEAIMNPKDALGQARKNFYEVFVNDYESMLETLPKSVRNKMLGKVPLVRNNFVNDLKDRGGLFTKMLSRTVRGVREFFTTTSTQKQVVVDQSGNIIDTLPVFYTGNARTEAALDEIRAEMDILRGKRAKREINMRAYEKQMLELESKFAALRNKPSLGEIDKDMTRSLIKFSTMAENFEAMGEIEDTMRAIVKVIEMRTYDAPGSATYIGKLYDKSKGMITKSIGKKNYDGLQSNAARRAHHFMRMSYYDNDKLTQGAVEKITNGLVNLSSLSYVAFNVFGNFNNLTIGQMNNAIEAMGGLYFTGQAYKRANKDAIYTGIAGLIRRTPEGLGDFADFTGRLATGSRLKLKSETYDVKKPLSLYEWLVDHYYMMDNKADIRETFGGREDTGTLWERFTSFGYSFNQGAEYFVQTKIGHAILYSTIIKNKKTGDELSLRDAWDWDAKTQTATLKEGYDTIVDKKTGFEQPYNDNFRARLRNRIREVNKQVHGNYAKEDRMVIQNNFLGVLIAQFHKWVMPAFRARFQHQYYDQNLGWLEGRYLSFYKFIKYITGLSTFGKRALATHGLDRGKSMGQGFKDAYGYTEDIDGNEFYDDQKANMLLKNVYRTLGEAFLILNLFILDAMLEGADDDDEGIERKLKNFTAYTVNRTKKEMRMFIPIPGLGDFQQIYQMAKTPIASTRTLGEIGEALELTAQTPLAWLFLSDEEFKQNSSYVYQNKPRKGELKLYKNWADALPVLYTIQKYASFEKNDDFYIK